MRGKKRNWLKSFIKPFLLFLRAICRSCRLSSDEGLSFAHLIDLLFVMESFLFFSCKLQLSIKYTRERREKKKTKISSKVMVTLHRYRSQRNGDTFCRCLRWTESNGIHPSCTANQWHCSCRKNWAEKTNIRKEFSFSYLCRFIIPSVKRRSFLFQRFSLEHALTARMKKKRLESLGD